MRALYRKFFVCIAGLCFVTMALHADIIEIHNMKELYSHLPEDALIVFDIDNTIMTPPYELGTDQWFEFRIQNFKDQGEEPGDAFKKTLKEWIALRNFTDMALVEEDIATIIQHLQDEGFGVMGLTTQGLHLSSRTLYQLNDLAVDFTKTSLSDEYFVFKYKNPVLYRDGILFGNGSHKGKVLFSFLEALSHNPSTVVFVDDKASNLIALEASCNEHGIPFVGLRYGYLDEKVKNFNAEVALEQLRVFGGHIISDEEAKESLR
jgi:FMN phosphatase YigB (HAD superfamily)